MSSDLFWAMFGPTAPVTFSNQVDYRLGSIELAHLYTSLWLILPHLTEELCDFTQANIGISKYGCDSLQTSKLSLQKLPV